MAHYEVLVSNIGVVYSGDKVQPAWEAWGVYTSQSKRNEGRAAGENVTLLRDNEIAYEHIGSLYKADQ